MKINVRADIKKALAMLDDTKKNIVPKAAARAINKVLTTVTAQAAREIKSDLGTAIKIADIKKGLVTKNAVPRNLYAELMVSGRRIPIIKIDPRARQNGSGVTWNTGQGKRNIPGAFRATMKTGHIGIYKRVGQMRLPIVELYGPSLPKVFSNRVILDALERIGREKWAKTFEHELNFLLTKYS